MCQFELMDPRETRIEKVDYTKVRTSQEQLKFAGTLHPLPEVTKTLNNRGPRKVPRESIMYLGIQHQQDSLNLIPGLHPIMATLLHTPPPLFAPLIGSLVF